MWLQSISLYGFKSFADRTELSVRPGITAIVGPNGCGKTNVADALRWALGEQSPKALRGQRMEDVIFHGSASRRPLGLAEVLLTFSNDGDVPVPWSEISVGRRLYRDGESDYLLNKTVCRLRDIHDLLLGTGVNPKAYALMEQERLAQILTGRPFDRRVLIEEAAGITRYKQQRAETIGKLEATRQNLLRVRDVMDEVKRQLASLERQAKRAQQYKALQAERRALELALLAAEHGALVGEETALTERETAERERAEALSAQVAALGAKQELGRADVMAAEHRAADLRHTLQRAEFRLEGCLSRAEQLRVLEQDQGSEVARLAEEGTSLNRRLESLAEERMARQELAEALRGEFAALQVRARTEEGTLEEMRTRLGTARERAESLRREQVTLALRRTELGQVLGGLEERGEQLRRRLGRVRAEAAQVADECRGIETEREAVTASVRAASNRAAELERELRRADARLAEVLADRAALAEASEASRVALAARRSSLQALEDLESERAGYGRGVRAVFAAAREARLGGVLGTVADLLEVPRDLERPVEAALGERLQWVVVETFAAAKAAVGYLGDNGGGQATFLPLDWLDGSPVARVPSGDGVLGVASQLLGCRHPALLLNLLGSLVVVRDLVAAERLWSTNGHGTSYVTVTGEVLSPPGVLAGGRATASGDASLLARKRAIRELSSSVTELEQTLESTLARSRTAEAELGGLTADQRAATGGREAAEAERLTGAKDLERLAREAERAALFADTCGVEIRELDAELEKTEAEMERHRADLLIVEAGTVRAAAEVAGLLETIEAETRAEQRGAQAFLDTQVELAALAGRLQGVQSDLQRIEADESEARHRIAAGAERRIALEARVAEGRAERTRLDAEAVAVRDERDAAQHASERAADELSTLGTRLRGLGEAAREAEQELGRAAQSVHGLVVRLAEIRVRREDVEVEARRQFEVDPDALRDADAPGRDLDAVRARLGAVSIRIAGLEPVNLLADEEYRELDERLAFLGAQHDDLTGSVRDLERALRGMTRTAQERFEEAFVAINRNFQELFARLFDGGRAELRLVEAAEGEDPLEAGIEMVAQPRGKRLQAISLLSGGEKALTGLALLFGIFYYRPSPFCLLDEVDAPLDDANIHRFTRVLRELAGRTQFLVITHNRKTMEAADVLYGVTMAEPGLSRVVSVSLA